MRSLFPLLFLLAACQYQSQWQCQQISTKQDSICSRLTYKSEDQVNGIDLEFLKAGSELITYLHLHSANLKEKAEVSVSTEDKNISFQADFHQGRQRLKIPESIQKEIIGFLQEGKAVTIHLSGYEETISPAEFEKYYKELEAK